MILTQTNKIRNLSKKEYEVLKELCHISKNLFNVGLYTIRQYYFTEKKYLSYESNYHECKSNENYKLLQAGISQQILKVVDRSFKSFFNLMKKAKIGEYRYNQIKLPHYLDKEGVFPLICSKNAISIKDGYFVLPISREYKKLNDVKIKIPCNLVDKNIKEVRIIPLFRGKYFDIQYVYEEKEEDLKLNKDNSLTIDVGLENLATCVDNTGTSFIMDGRKIKSINQYYNKKMAKLKSIADKQKYKYTNRISRLIESRNNKTKDQIKKTSRYIVNYCIKNDIGTIIAGYNCDFKRNINIGKKNNQNFTQISFGELRNTIKYLCERYCIQYIEQEESYTSKSSFLDKDKLPKYNPEAKEKYKFSGRRIKRGLYKSKKGQIINADVNGACNILRKSKQNFNFEKLCRGLVDSPKRIRLI